MADNGDSGNRLDAVGPEETKADGGAPAQSTPPEAPESATAAGGATTSNAGAAESGGASASAPKVDPASVLFKTRLCKDWERSGWCSWGQMCIFAHSRQELRTVSENEERGIINDVAVQKERAKLLTDSSKKDRPPRPAKKPPQTTPPYKSPPPGTPPYQPPPPPAPAALASKTPPAPFVFDPYTGAPYFPHSVPTVPGLPPNLAPPLFAPLPVNGFFPTQAPLLSFGLAPPIHMMPLMQNVAGFPVLNAAGLPYSTAAFPQATAPAPAATAGKAMSVNAAPFVPTTLRKTAGAAAVTPPPPPPPPPPSATATHATSTLAAPRRPDEDEDEDFSTIIRDAVDNIQQETQGGTRVDAHRTYHEEDDDPASGDDDSFNQFLARMTFMDK